MWRIQLVSWMFVVILTIASYGLFVLGVRNIMLLALYNTMLVKPLKKKRAKWSKLRKMQELGIPTPEPATAARKAKAIAKDQPQFKGNAISNVLNRIPTDGDLVRFEQQIIESG